jgi:signal transduction histidine kinase
LLADRGLALALQAQADRAVMPVQVDGGGIGRLSREAEVTVYFCVLEALRNVAKYADASMTTISLHRSDGQLMFQVADDGAGFDPASVAAGTGLRGMSDRLAAVGGELGVMSKLGGGTTVIGSLPVTCSA